MRLITGAAVAAVFCLALSGCSGAERSDSVDRGSNADVPAVSVTPTEEPPGDTGPGRFGQWFTYNDGVAVRVGKPVVFKPSYAGVVEHGGVPLRFAVTVVNHTKKPLDLDLFTSSLQSGNKEAEELFDSGAGLDGSPSTTLLPGRESKFFVGYGVKNPQDLVMQVAPDFDHDAVFWATTSARESCPAQPLVGAERGGCCAVSRGRGVRSKWLQARS